MAGVVWRAVATSAVLVGVAAAAVDADAATFAPLLPNGGEQTYTVPAGVTRVNVVAVGAPGGTGSGVMSHVGGAGGRGALAAADLDVRPGEVLYVEVGRPGLDAGITTGQGGFNGGGSSLDGGGGGGASDVRTCSITASSCGPGVADSAHSRLLVAAGGGGGSGASSDKDGSSGGSANVVNGDAGGNGSEALNGEGYGMGGEGATDAVGGSGGTSAVDGQADCAQIPPGGSGTFGAGGSARPNTLQEGGGGGGGDWGGGAGGSGCIGQVLAAIATGGGGGGGSSYGPPGTAFAANVIQGPSVTVAPLPSPALVVAPGSLTFGSQPMSTVSVPRNVTLTNDGPATLRVSGVQIAGSGANDFFVGSSTCGGVVASGASCQLTVRFAPSAQGARSGSLQILSNDPNSPGSVGLSGTGTQLPQGPPGPAGKQGPAGKIELVTCKTVTRTVTRVIRHKRRKVKVTQQQCKTRTVSGTVTFSTGAGVVKASVSRGGTVYATGTSAALGHGHSQLVLVEVRRLRPGRYTLTLSSRAHGHTTVRHTTITIAEAS